MNGKRKGGIRICIVLVSTLLFLSCRSVDLSPYPKQERSVFLQTFANNSFEADVNLELTEILRHEILRRGNFILMDERKNAGMRVYGRLEAYRREGRMFDNYRYAVRTEILIFASARFYRIASGGKGTTLLLNREFRAEASYSATQGRPETERSARRRALYVLAVRIADAMENAYLADRSRKNPVAADK